MKCRVQVIFHSKDETWTSEFVSESTSVKLHGRMMLIEFAPMPVPGSHAITCDFDTQLHLLDDEGEHVHSFELAQCGSLHGGDSFTPRLEFDIEEIWP